MALDTTRLAAAIRQAFLDVGAIDPAPDLPLTALSTALSEAIITEFLDNAEVVVTMPPDGTGTIT